MHMNEKIEIKRKKVTAAEMPIHTIREGSVAASIWRRMSPAGYEYFDFSLGRSWKSLSSGGTGNSRNFFSRNQSELIKVVQEACRWIAAHESAQEPNREERSAA